MKKTKKTYAEYTETPQKKNNAAVLKIIVPLVILAAVAGIWLLKNMGDNIDGGSLSNDTVTEQEENPHFALNVTEELDLEELKSYGLPIIIDFGADSCAPCREMAPALEKLNRELRDKAIIKFVDVWKYSDLATGYPVTYIPTQIFIDANGNPYSPDNPEELNLNIYTDKNTNEHLFTVHVGGLSEEQMLELLYDMGMQQ